MPKIINSQGSDIIKGGVFFGTNLTPSGVFSNIPNTTTISENQNITINPSIILTLGQIKNSLNQNLEKTTTGSLSDSTLNSFLTNYIQLLIDYEDIRNTVFFGSSYNELSYQISYLSESFPYKVYVAKSNLNTTTPPSNPEILKLETRGQNTTFYFESNNIINLGDLNSYLNVNFTTNGNYSWVGDYDVIDVNKNRYPIVGLETIKTGIINEVSYQNNQTYIIGIKTNQNITEGGIISFYSDNSLKVKLADAEIINTPFYSEDQVYVTLKFNNLTSGVNTDLQILKIGEICVFSFTAIEFKINASNFITSSSGTITLAENGEDGSTSYGLYNDFKQGDVLKIINKTSNGEDILFKTLGSIVVDSFSNPSSEQIIISFTNFLNLTNGEYSDNDVLSNLSFIKLSDNVIRTQVKGRLTSSELITYKGSFVNDPNTNQNVQVVSQGVLFSPNINNIVSFENQLNGVQKALLNVLNPTPWPREPITNNILTSGDTFKQWIQNPANMIKNEDNFDSSYYRDDTGLAQYDLIGATTIDENETNQLIRRAIPEELINEINETDGRLFSRFVLLAGKLFDTIKIYIDFLEYVHTVNYSEFNQLSPNFYSLYAEHYGLTLSEEGNEDYLSSLVFNTTNIRSSLYAENSTLLDTVKLQELVQKRQKNLLVNLLYIYSKKGTTSCINSLINLLGSPNGLMTFIEYDFSWDSKLNYGYKRKNNNKVNVPETTYIIDTSKLKDKTNINNPINKPLYYKPVYDNENTFNLREVSFNMDMLESISEDIYNYIKTKKQYVYFKPGTFLNLQPSTCPKTDVDTTYYGLPLSFPEKFSGVSIDYFIDKNSSNNLQAAKFQLCGLYKLAISNSPNITYTAGKVDYIKDYYSYKTPLIKNLEPIDSKDENFLPTHYPSVIKISESDLKNYDNGVNYLWTINYESVLPFPIFNTSTDQNKSLKTIKNYINNNCVYKKDDGSKQQIFNAWIEGDTFLCIAFNYTLSCKTCYLNKITLDSSNIPIIGSNSPLYFSQGRDSAGSDEYIVASLEGKDLVVRLGLKNKLGLPQNRIAICENIFSNDSLTHSLKLTYRLEGIEIFLDYKFYKFISWKITPLLYNSIYYPKSEIHTCIDSPLSEDILNEEEVIRGFWDMTNGYPSVEKDTIEGESWRISIGATTPDNVVWNIGDIVTITSIDRSHVPPTCVYIQTLSNNYKYNSTLQWWDMFIGLPVDIDMNISKVSVFEKLYINQPDFEETGKSNLLNHEIEKWWFNFSNQKKDSNGNYITDSIAITANYNSSYPVINSNIDLNYPTTSYVANLIDTYFVENYSEVILSTVDRNTVYLKSVDLDNPNAFKTIKLNLYNNANFIEKSLDSIEIFSSSENVKNIVQQTGWSSTVHNDYKYYGVNNMIDNYYSFSQNVLDYLTLLKYSTNNKNKFESIVKQFIPIVINISSFNILYKFVTEKVRYQKTFISNSIGTYIDSSSEASFTILPSILSNCSYQITLKNNSTVFKTFSGNIYNSFSRSQTVTDIVNLVNVNGEEIYTAVSNKNKITISINTGNFIDKWNTDSNYPTINPYDVQLEFSTTHSSLSDTNGYLLFGDVIPFSASHRGTVGNNSIIVSYSKPKFITPITKHGKYIYYKRENGNDPYIYTKEEFNNNNIQNLYI